MKFINCLDKLIEGKQLRRLSWPDDGIHIAFIQEKLMIWKSEDNQYHPLIISLGDILGTDWKVCERSNLVISGDQLEITGES